MSLSLTAKVNIQVSSWRLPCLSILHLPYLLSYNKANASKPSSVLEADASPILETHLCLFRARATQWRFKHYQFADIFIWPNKFQFEDIKIWFCLKKKKASQVSWTQRISRWLNPFWSPNGYHLTLLASECTSQWEAQTQEPRNPSFKPWLLPAVLLWANHFSSTVQYHSHDGHFMAEVWALIFE